MTDHDDAVSRRYRDLAREEPPATLDAAITAHAHRAVARPRASWVRGLSVAAVLVLALGITLRMQHEEPGVETSMPGVPPPPPVEQREAAPAAPLAPAADLPATGKQVEAVEPAPSSQMSTPTAKDAAATADDAHSRGNVAPEPAPAGGAAAKMEAPSAARAEKRTQQKSIAHEADIETELERIAALRAAGRDADADAALAHFRDRHPAYRIPDAMWTRIKPR